MTEQSRSCDAILLSMTIQTNGLGMCSVEGQNVRWRFQPPLTAEHHKHRGEASVPATHNDTMMYAEEPSPERLFVQRGQTPKFPSTI